MGEDETCRDHQEVLEEEEHSSMERLKIYEALTLIRAQREWRINDNGGCSHKKLVCRVVTFSFFILKQQINRFSIIINLTFSKIMQTIKVFLNIS